VYVALYVLGYEGDELTKMLGPNPIAFARERLRVDFGERGASLFDFWFSYQALISMLVNLTDPRTSNVALRDHDFDLSVLEVIDPLRAAAHQLGVVGPLTEALAAVDDCFRRRPAPDVESFSALRESVVGHFLSTARQVLGIEEIVTSGPIVHLGITYQTAYRLANVIGVARAKWVFGAVVGADTERGDPKADQYSVRAAVDALRVMRTLPSRRLPKLRAAFARLNDVEAKLEVADWERIWNWMDTFFTTAIGAHSNQVYDLSCQLEVFSIAMRFENGEAIAFDALKAIEAALSDMHSHELAQRARVLIQEVQNQEARLRSVAAPCLELQRDVRDWISNLLTQDDVTKPNGWTHNIARRFSSFWVPVDEERVAAFLRQFGSDHRWIGEGLLEAVEFFDEAYFSRSLAHLLRPFLTSDPSFCLFGGPRKSAAMMSYILDRRLPAQYEDLRAVLGSARNGPIIFVDDCIITGTQADHVVRELVGTWRKANHKYSAPLTTEELAALRARPLKFVFGIGTDAGRVQLSKLLDESRLDHEIIVGREFPLLSEQGRTALAQGSLFDGEAIRDPVLSLATPLFSPFERVWPRDKSWEEARDFCEHVGYELLARRANSNEWSEGRRRASALGYSGVQGRLVFGHNVPKTTLTMLWESGAVDGHPWIPLFPSRE
jgi:hypothetical protein